MALPHAAKAGNFVKIPGAGNRSDVPGAFTWHLQAKAEAEGVAVTGRIHESIGRIRQATKA